MVWTIFENLRVQKNLNIEKITFKVVQMNSKKCILISVEIFMVRNIFMEYDLSI